MSSIKIINIRFCEIFLRVPRKTNISLCDSVKCIVLIIESVRRADSQMNETYCNCKVNVTKCNAKRKPQHTVCIEHCTVS